MVSYSEPVTSDLVTYSYRNYLLSCDAARIAPGQFQAHVVIARRDDLCIVASQFFSAMEPFANDADAVEYARTWAVEWIDQHAH
jgi:hypothetical protein